MAGHAVDQGDLPRRLDPDFGVGRGRGHVRGGEQGVRRGEPPGPGRVGVPRPGRPEIVAGHGVEGQVAALHQPHELARECGVEPFSLDQEPEHRAEGHGQGDHQVVGLGEHGVAGHVRGELRGLARVADRDGQGAFDGLGGVRVAAGAAPGLPLLDPAPPGVPDGLAGVVARAAHRGPVEQREKLLVQAAAEVRGVVPAALHQGAEREFEDEPGLGELAGLEPVVVAAGPGVGVAVDPLPEVAAQLGQVVVPVRAQAQRIAHEGPQEGSGGAVLDIVVRHVSSSGVGGGGRGWKQARRMLVGTVAGLWQQQSAAGPVRRPLTPGARAGIAAEC